MSSASPAPEPGMGPAIDLAPRPTWDPSRGLIPRKRLMERLRGWSQCPIVLASAPAGYGKTTALAEWDSVDPRPFAWVPVEERHDDATLLAQSIATALDELEPIDPSIFDLLTAERAGISAALLPRLRETIRGRERPFVLVLDDLHRLSSAESLQLVTGLGRAVGVGSQMALSTRGEPPIPVGRLRSEGRLAELGAADLAMTRGELRALLAIRNLELDADSVRMLSERTEGWPVANYLATVILEDEEDPSVAVRRVSGEDRVLVDYLREELFSSLPSEEYGFLVSCAALERLEGGLCDAALDRRGSAELLRRLSRSNLLLFPLDRLDREYRLHSLLREALLAELARGTVVDAAEIHARASAWYAGRGDFDRAIPHAIASGAIEAAGELIWASAADYASHGREATLRRHLGHYSEAQISAWPPLALALATSSLARGEGREIERWTAAARSSLPSAPEEQRNPLRISADLIHASGAFHGELAEMRRAAARARGLLPPDSSWGALACLIEGAAIHLSRSGDDPRPMLEEGSRRSATLPTVRTLCQAQRILIALEDGDEQLAWSLEEQASETIERFGIGDLETESLVLAVSALIRGRRGRIDDAVLGARRATALLATSAGISSWYEAETRIVLARALLQLDDIAAARAQLADAKHHLARVPDAPALERMYEEALADAAEKAAGGGRWPLTRAELRLLQLLPTHLSFREIGERLFVSTNTVKSQARSIYRKLGVRSRAEAVSTARAGGLLAAASEPADRAL